MAAQIAPAPNKSHQSILVVGGGAGIGYATVKNIIDTTTNTKLVVFDRDVSGLHALRGPRLNCVEGDVTDKEDRARVMSQCVEFMQGVDTVVYCAGVINPIERIEKLDVEDVGRAFDVNVLGCLGMVQLCLPHLRHSRTMHPTNAAHGKLIILTSACDLSITYHGWMPYCTSKAALTRFITCLAHEEPLITVQGVYPKLTRTKMPEDVIAGRYRGVMADHEIERFRVWDSMGEEMVERPEKCGRAVARLAVGLVEGGRSGVALYYDEHVPEKIVGT
ncbi:NAD(P)-binding protein [Byssothecium circinans]|uniref:NAD(P)-binding protein n=1 Tax=Byssothecium circinans TaxID=147558 RepID=A0A6A5TCZ2_9PLEO|nr:NAD(P)-binding protein [Byssothecium circinans]